MGAQFEGGARESSTVEVVT